MLDTWINFADGFILVYAINDKETFESLTPRYDRIVRNKQGQNPKMIVVGNKCDLVSERKVTEEEAQSQCKQWKVPFIEASALVFYYKEEQNKCKGVVFNTCKVNAAKERRLKYF